MRQLKLKPRIIFLKGLYLITLLFLFFTFSGCGAAPTGSSSPGKIKVYTSIYPLYDFASRVGGDKIELKNIIPPGAEPHTWEPAPRDAADVSKADVLVYCGSGIDPWAEKIIESGMIDSSQVKVVKAAENVQLLRLGNDSEDNHHHHHGNIDPHVWLDPLNAQKMVSSIAAALSEVDKANAEYYQRNAAEFNKELDELHHKYLTVLGSAKKKEFVVSHAAFGYLAERYGLKQIPIRGLSPDMEPNPRDMAEIIELAKEKDIKYIFFEKMVSPKVSETIAAELNAKTLLLNPLGNLTEEEIKEGVGYIEIMEQNLNNLNKALN
ncbi:MAG: zinc ABC transporter substrate-binding protein [Desulfotomaculum sp.]|nr:zinc ABC transporter substrate-binding protein [Desulfotomaculum sp.]